MASILNAQTSGSASDVTSRSLVATRDPSTVPSNPATDTTRPNTTLILQTTTQSRLPGEVGQGKVSKVK